MYPPPHRRPLLLELALRATQIRVALQDGRELYADQSLGCVLFARVCEYGE